MYFTLLGLPAAGKGTQAKKISQVYDLTHISTGDIFRRLIEEETAFGIKAKKYIEQGKLVPDQDTIQILTENLQQVNLERGCVLDGFPRTLKQAESLTVILAEMGLKLDLVFYLQVDKEVLVHRLSGRRVCPNCGATYHLEYNPPQVKGSCDRCKHHLIQRADDKPDTLQRRLQASSDEMDKLVDYYQEQGILVSIPSEKIETVFTRIKQAIEVRM